MPEKGGKGRRACLFSVVHMSWRWDMSVPVFVPSYCLSAYLCVCMCVALHILCGLIVFTVVFALL